MVGTGLVFPLNQHHLPRWSPQRSCYRLRVVVRAFRCRSSLCSGAAPSPAAPCFGFARPPGTGQLVLGRSPARRPAATIPLPRRPSQPTPTNTARHTVVASPTLSPPATSCANLPVPLIAPSHHHSSPRAHQVSASPAPPEPLIQSPDKSAAHHLETAWTERSQRSISPASVSSSRCLGTKIR